MTINTIHKKEIDPADLVIPEDTRQEEMDQAEGRIIPEGWKMNLEVLMIQGRYSQSKKL